MDRQRRGDRKIEGQRGARVMPAAVAGLDFVPLGDRRWQSSDGGQYSGRRTSGRRLGAWPEMRAAVGRPDNAHDHRVGEAEAVGR